MTEKELLKLKRSEMLEIMLAQSREIDKLREELEEAKAKVEDRELRLKDCGNIAEASLRLTNIFTEAQKAVDLYVENIKRRALQREAAQHREKTGKAPAAGDEITRDLYKETGKDPDMEIQKETHRGPAAGRIDGEAERNE